MTCLQFTDSKSNKILLILSSLFLMPQQRARALYPYHIEQIRYSKHILYPVNLWCNYVTENERPLTICAFFCMDGCCAHKAIWTSAISQVPVRLVENRKMRIDFTGRPPPSSFYLYKIHMWDEDEVYIHIRIWSAYVTQHVGPCLLLIPYAIRWLSLASFTLFYTARILLLTYLPSTNRFL